MMKLMPYAGCKMGRVIRGSEAPEVLSKQLCTAVLALSLAFVNLASAALPEEALIIPGTLPLDTDGHPVGPQNHPL
jgi:hypothetical protein